MFLICQWRIFTLWNYKLQKFSFSNGFCSQKKKYVSVLQRKLSILERNSCFFLTKQNQPKSQTETKQIYLFTLIFTCVSILWLRVNKFFWVAFQIKNSWIELSLKITSLPGSVICNVKKTFLERRLPNVQHCQRYPPHLNPLHVIPS